MLSIVIPAYNEEDNIERTADKVGSLMRDNEISYEIVFVNDGSKDKTWEKILEAKKKDENITAISLSRNFGKEGAVFAGLNNSSGDACVVMDCDLQHPAEVIIDMYNIWKNNDIDVVEGVKNSRGKEGIFYKIFAKTFYRIIKKVSGIDMTGSSDFKLMDRKVVESLKEMPEKLTFFRAMSSWVGFKTEKIYFDVAPRLAGESKWSFKTLAKFAVNSITSFTSAPLQVVTAFGILDLLATFILGVLDLCGVAFSNTPFVLTLPVYISLFTSGIIMIALGVIGYYISKIYEEVKSRPRYVIGNIVKSKNSKI